MNTNINLHSTPHFPENARAKVFGILRDYQVLAVNKVLESFDSGKNAPLLQSPTGSGKSIMILAIAIDALATGKRVGLVIHKDELLRQWQSHFSKWLPNFPVSTIGNKAKYGKLKDVSAPLQIMSIKILNKMPERPELDLLIFDEAHHSPATEWAEVIAYYRSKNTKLLGATATPCRLDGRGLDVVELGQGKDKKIIPAFDVLIPGPQTADLIDAGHLVPVEVYASELEVNTDDVKMTAGEYNQGDLEQEVINQIPVEKVVEEWERIALDKMTIGYPVSVAYSIALTNAFNDKFPGVARHVDSNTPYQERVNAFKEFADGKFKILFQHSIVIEGVDIPSVECVLCVRPTASNSVWLQILGRGLRPAPGKSAMILIDFTDNHKRLPMPQDKILWGLSGMTVNDFRFCPCCEKERRVYFNREEEREELVDTFTLGIGGGIETYIKRYKYYNCSKCSTEIEVEVQEKEKKEKSEPTIEERTLSKVRLSKRNFNLKQFPDFYRYLDAPGDKEFNLCCYVFHLHEYRRNKKKRDGTTYSPYWGLFQLVKNYDREDMTPSNEVLYLAYQAFTNKGIPNSDELKLPDLSNQLHKDRIADAYRHWKWAEAKLASESETESVA